MPYFKNYDNADLAGINLLKYLSVEIDPENVINELSKHPDNPSLLAISDVFTWFGIENGAYNVKAEELPDIQTPFIAHTRQNSFVVVRDVSGEHFVIADDKHKKI